jgi:hypothetical protein
MHVNVLVRLFSDGSRPIITIVMSHLHNSSSASIKFTFILYEGLRTTSFEKSWEFRFPRPIPNHLNLTLIGVTYTAAIFEGIQRGLHIGVTSQEPPPLVDLQSDDDNDDGSEE